MPRTAKNILLGAARMIQIITIKKSDDGSITLEHSHRDHSFGENFPPVNPNEIYGPRSDEGTLSAVRNLLSGYQPWPSDLTRAPGEPEPIKKGWPAPRPLD